MYVAATDQGLCRVTLPNESFATLTKWVERSIANAQLIANTSVVNTYTKEIAEYLIGERTSFTCALDLIGTSFQKQVWMELANIPYGTTVSYGDVAKRIGRPKAVRAVGAASSANPLPIVLPCHRVIGQNGRLTGYRGGLAMKKSLLQLEGSIK
ncbi:hypothetical protein BM613_00815 [Sulfoacidibacillus thermotolerans]|uniref:Methylated-DNA--protein-cysteine methyltransferase n=2 Tax=Sulfoacidibacillus thermotolerans TaxID=1765684 RepID=A0A2U3DCJ0_SULT2|nr:hypothetical protein BM613_00815 [Sulfoacidibacillus thermotolerans]